MNYKNTFVIAIATEVWKYKSDFRNHNHSCVLFLWLSFYMQLKAFIYHMHKDL